MAPERMNVTIVGAGLAGLLSARVLREHHNVTILERTHGNKEVGAGTAIGPTGSKIIDELGLDRQKAGANLWFNIRFLNKAGEIIRHMNLRPSLVATGSDFLEFHRADLWDEFLRLATAPSHELGVQGQPAKLISGVEVVDVDVENGDVTLADGKKIQSDLVIAADGIKSLVRTLVIGDEAAKFARPSGAAAFRFTMPAEKLRSIHPYIYINDPSHPGACDVCLPMDGTSRSLVMYSIRSYELVNFVAICPDDIIDQATEESWSAKGTTEDLLKSFGDYSTFFTDILKQAEDIKLWQLRDQDPLPTYVKGRTVLIGDAAHAMTPHQAQGATQAIEDAEGFVLFNSPDFRKTSIPEILKDFDRVRRTRASRIQNASREAVDRKTPEEISMHYAYKSTYGGIERCLERLNNGEEMIPVKIG